MSTTTEVFIRVSHMSERGVWLKWHDDKDENHARYVAPGDTCTVLIPPDVEITRA